MKFTFEWMGPTAGFCGDGDEPLGNTTTEFFHQSNDCSEEISVPWSWSQAAAAEGKVSPVLN
jgi:hypothetical protein